MLFYTRLIHLKSISSIFLRYYKNALKFGQIKQSPSVICGCILYIPTHSDHYRHGLSKFPNSLTAMKEPSWWIKDRTQLSARVLEKIFVLDLEIIQVKTMKRQRRHDSRLIFPHNRSKSQNMKAWSFLSVSWYTQPFVLQLVKWSLLTPYIFPSVFLH